ncbi:MAG TPA: hypothetical protein VM261_04150 [Kofleriaceae bacterium]|nr:hypothetical protein [Kofleriaceae bacterium]
MRRAWLAACVLGACGERADVGGSAQLASTPAITAGAEWRYWDRGGDLGTAWRMGAFDDSAWARGAGPLGYGESYVSTTVAYGSSSSAKHITTYVRRTFEVADPSTVIGMRGRLMYDDGVVIHLNGAELARVAMPASGAITASALSAGHEANNTYATLDWSASTGLLLPGTNTIAVEIHQADPASSDLVFDLALDLESVSDVPVGERGIARNATWRFWDNGGDLGTAWRMTLGGTGWDEGEGVFGYGESYIDTPVSHGASSAAKHLTTYFTKAFEVDDASAITSMVGEVMYDDGFVAYLNGAELGRAAMPSGAITASTRASGHEAANDYGDFDWSGRAGLLRDGTNVLAVEVHQESSRSSDLVFDLALVLADDGDPGPGSGWLGDDHVTTADTADDLGGDLSDLFVEAGVMWTVNNYRGALVKLVPNGSRWTDASTRILRYPGGGGHPDAEGVTRAELSSSAIYVAAERNNSASGTSRLSVLRYDTAASGVELVATHEWNLTSYLPAASANSGLEAIRWIPDSVLVAAAFHDEAAGHTYDPAEYTDHGTGLFLVGVEGTGAVHVFALDHADGSRHRLATFASGLPHVMALEVDRADGTVWAHCDSACGNRTNVVRLAAGRFTVVAEPPSPASMPDDVDNEGIAVEPAAACVAGKRRFYWCDERATDDHVLRVDLVPCAP